MLANTKDNFFIKEADCDLKIGDIFAFAELPDGRQVFGLRTDLLVLKEGFEPIHIHFNKSLCQLFTLQVLNDNFIAVGGADNTIFIVNLRSPKSISLLNGHDRWICCLTTLPKVNQSGQFLVSGSMDNSIKIWDVSSNSCIANLQGHAGPVFALSVLPNTSASLGGTLLISGSSDQTIRLWDSSTGRCLVILTGHKDTVRTLEILPGDKFASGSDDCTIKIWNSQHYFCMDTWAAHEGGILTLKLLINGILASGSSDNTIRLWNVSTGECYQTLQQGRGVYSLAQLSNGSLISICRNKIVTVWKMSIAQSFFAFQQHSSTVMPLVDKTRTDSIDQMPDSIAPLEALFIESSLVKDVHALRAGAFAQVYYAQLSDGRGGQTVIAIKQYDQTAISTHNYFKILDDIQKIKNVKSPFLARLIGVVRETKIDAPLRIVMEYCEHGSLCQNLHLIQKTSWFVRLKMMRDLVSGLAYLHQLDLIHGALNSHNVLFRLDFTIVLADFSLISLRQLCTNLPDHVNEKLFRDSIRWKAPEQLVNAEPLFTKAADIWSLGKVLCELIMGEISYGNIEDLTQLREVILKDDVEVKGPIGCEDKAPELASAIRACGFFDPKSRPDAKDLCHAAGLSHF